VCRETLIIIGRSAEGVQKAVSLVLKKQDELRQQEKRRVGFKGDQVCMILRN